MGIQILLLCAVLPGWLFSVHPSTLTNQYAFSISEHDLKADTPLNPQRSKCVRRPSEDVLLEGTRVQKSVLDYLKEQITRCREDNRRDEVRWYYESGREFALGLFYGPIPPRPEVNLRGAGAPAEATPRKRAYAEKRPLQRIIRRFTDGDGNKLEVLACGHHIQPFSFETVDASETGTLAKHRRCDQCFRQANQKKQSATVTAKKKAVTA